ncbi:MAG: LytTR family DNA-binding domain-containing protein [Lachnospiraceae bacterium]|nr:LytTR family DNA-binding domain-containing protein [Lachnospiraceae bacterium]
MNIAVCDDNRQDVDQLCAILLSIDENMMITRFLSGTDLLAGSEQQRFDLVFLDTAPGKEDGIAVAGKFLVRQPQAGIAFVTGDETHAVEAFRLRALHYLLKPCTAEDVAEVLRRLRRPEEQLHMLTLPIGRDIRTLPQRDIVKVESSGHHTMVHTVDGAVCSVRRTFHEIAELLDEDFIQIKRGVCVNMHHIVRFNSTELTLTDDTEYLIRRDRRRAIRETYTAFVKKKPDKTKNV